MNGVIRVREGSDAAIEQTSARLAAMLRKARENEARLERILEMRRLRRRVDSQKKK